MTKSEGQQPGWSKAAQRRKAGRFVTAPKSVASPEDRGQQHEAEATENKS